MPRTIRFHLDEHCDPAIAAGLRLHGVDVTTTPEAHLLNAEDEEHIAYGMTTGRVGLYRCRTSTSTSYLTGPRSTPPSQCDGRSSIRPTRLVRVGVGSGVLIESVLNEAQIGHVDEILARKTLRATLRRAMAPSPFCIRFCSRRSCGNVTLRSISGTTTTGDDIVSCAGAGYIRGDLPWPP